MLFQMCYGPEIQAIYENVKRNPGQDTQDLKQKFQYSDEGDITSLIECSLTMLEDLNFVAKKESRYFAVEERAWSNKEVLRRLQKITRNEEGTGDSLNYIFASLYEQFFVKPDRLFMTNLHYHINSKYSKTLVGHEKINAWKRIMECWGLGRRLYSGFYALPHLSLLLELISNVDDWDGGLHPFCEKIVHPILPCLTSEGNIYQGLIFGLSALHRNKQVCLSFKQDLPYKSYGPNQEWNWIKIDRKVNGNASMPQ